jgi:ABC-type cobalt transport system substrate-binding protein
MKKLIVMAMVLAISLLSIVSVASAEHGDIGGLARSTFRTMERGDIKPW